MKVGQKVWYIDHIFYDVLEGTVVDTKASSGMDELPTMIIDGTSYGIKTNVRVLTDWVFDNESDCNKALVKYIDMKIGQKEAEVKHLKGKKTCM